MIGQAKRLVELNKIKQFSKKKGSTTPIIAITSGKGGTGKTFVSINIAYALARNNKKVLLIDLDANLSNVNIMLNIAQGKNLYDFFAGNCDLPGLIHKYDNNLHLLFGDSGRTDHPELIESRVNTFFDSLYELSSAYDYILLDTAAGAGEDVLSILSMADARVLVTTPEPTAVMDAYAILKLLSNNKIIDRKYLLVNNVNSLSEGKSTFENLNKAVTHFLKEEVILLGIIEHDASVPKSIRNQKIFMIENPDNRITLQLLKISKRFDEIGQLVNNNH